MTNSVESRALTHLESIGLGSAAFISMGGPQAHGNSKPLNERFYRLIAAVKIYCSIGAAIAPATCLPASSIGGGVHQVVHHVILAIRYLAAVFLANIGKGSELVWSS